MYFSNYREKKGETMTTEEVANNFEDLCKEEIPSHFTSTQLIEDMLGFQHIQNQV